MKINFGRDKNDYTPTNFNWKPRLRSHQKSILSNKIKSVLKDPKKMKRMTRKKLSKIGQSLIKSFNKKPSNERNFSNPKSGFNSPMILNSKQIFDR